MCRVFVPIPLRSERRYTCFVRENYLVPKIFQLVQISFSRIFDRIYLLLFVICLRCRDTTIYVFIIDSCVGFFFQIQITAGVLYPRKRGGGRERAGGGECRPRAAREGCRNGERVSCETTKHRSQR